jgi:hypothetical protein
MDLLVVNVFVFCCYEVEGNTDTVDYVIGVNRRKDVSGVLKPDISCQRFLEVSTNNQNWYQ